MKFETSPAIPVSAATHGNRLHPIVAGGWRETLKAAAFAFALSRLIVLLSAMLTIAMAQQWGGAQGNADQIRLLTPASVDTVARYALSNDANWYLSIAQNGYETRPFNADQQANWAFFPLHPYLWRILNATGLPPAWVGIAFSNLLFLLALIQSHRWIKAIRDKATADRTVLCIALFPTAYFFSLPWTESLFLLLTASSLLATQQSQWGRATMANALASATRPTGVLLTALMWWESRNGRRLPPPHLWVLAVLGASGLFVFMLLLWQKTGNPLAFSDIQAAWGRDGGSLTKHLRRWIMDPLLLTEAWNTRWINNGGLLLGLTAVVWLWRQRLRALALFAFVSLLLPWSTGTLMSMGRYVVSCLPIFLAFGCWLDRPSRQIAWFVLSACALAGMTACFVLGATFAGA